jgi:TusA-related sulfurtransferase
MAIVDARGLLCPEPVVLTQRAIKDGTANLTVLVDAVAAKENVTRFAASRGYNVLVDEENGEWKLALSRK